MTRYLPYTLTLEAPLLLPATGSNPNAVPTLRYIPGASVRGALAAAIAPAKGVEPDAEFRALILDGSVCWLPAYPMSGDRRSLPVPKSWRKRKEEDDAGDSIRVIDMAAHGSDEDASQLAPLMAGFVILDDQPTMITPETSWQLHVQMSRKLHRAARGDGAVFNYESLNAHQRFQGLVALTSSDLAGIEALAEAIQSRMGGRIWMGRSRAAGYGGWVKVEWHALQERELEKSSRQLTRINAGSLFTILLTSDYVGRDPDTGAWDGNRLEAEIQDALDPEATRVSRSWEGHWTGGFNRKWGMELPQTRAVAAGSVLVYRASRDISEERLLAFEQQGRGERRSEGFGRAIVITPPDRTLRVWRSRPGRPTKPDGTPPALIAAMELRIREQHLRQKIDEVAASAAAAPQTQNIPTGHLLSRFRLLLRDPDRGYEALQKMLRNDGHILRARALEQVRQCRIAGKGILEQLEQAPGSMKSVIEKPGSITGEIASLQEQEQLWQVARVEYAAALLGALSRKAREKRREEVAHAGN